MTGSAKQSSTWTRRSMDCFVASLLAITRRATSLSRLFGFAEIRPIGQPNSILKRGARAPAQFGKAADVEQFARRAVGPRGVEADLAAVPDSRGHHAREFGNGNVFAGADVGQFIRGVVLHQVNAGIRHVVDVEEFPPRRAGAPDHDILDPG